MTEIPAWPSGCVHPNACKRHRACMYISCAHADRRAGLVKREMEAYEANPPAINRLGCVRDISDEELLRRAVNNARASRGRANAKHPRLTAVMDVFALGSTYARQLCARFGVEPEEMVKR
jgi:hypothetical protein